ncbi:barstar family protein [Streptomyces sp. NPDC050738]|uniref:barstar family protein n=1 Tax=Streptomyces sp. NPDC050738 TaxID=3154744 RepID=UPI0034324923
MTPTLTERRSPWVVVTSAGDPQLEAETAALLRKGGVVLRLDGRELGDEASLFRVFARELSFPGYFGHNWDALVDCLRDWHGPGHGAGRGQAVLIEHADGLRDADFLGLLVSVLAQAAWHSNLRLDADGNPDDDWAPMVQHFVLVLDGTAPLAFAEPAARGTDVAVAWLDGRLLATLTDIDWPGGDAAAPPWAAGPLDFADDDILRGAVIQSLVLFRSRLDCSIHEAMGVFVARYDFLRRERGADFTVSAAEYGRGFYS